MIRIERVDMEHQGDIPSHVQDIELWHEAAGVLVAGVVQRLEDPGFDIGDPRLKDITPAVLVRVEYMLIWQAMHDLLLANASVTYDSLMEATRLHEPGKAFGFACGTLAGIWEKRESNPVSDSDLELVVDILLHKRTAPEYRERVAKHPRRRPWWRFWARGT